MSDVVKAPSDITESGKLDHSHQTTTSKQVTLIILCGKNNIKSINKQKKK